MGITMTFDLEFIDIVNNIIFYPALLIQPWGQIMNETIPLEKYRIKLK